MVIIFFIFFSKYFKHNTKIREKIRQFFKNVFRLHLYQCMHYILYLLYALIDDKNKQLKRIFLFSSFFFLTLYYLHSLLHFVCRTLYLEDRIVFRSGKLNIE